MSKFGPFRMKIMEGSLPEYTDTQTRTDFSVPWYTIIATFFYTYTAYLKGHNYHNNFTHLTPN